MNKKLMPFLALVPVSAALALGAAFANTSASVVDGNLRVVFGVTGVDPTMSSADFTVTGGAKVTYACVNRGGNNPPASNKRMSASLPINGSIRLKASSGRINGIMQVPPPSVSLQCPPGQDKRLASVTYGNVQIASPTLKISAPIRGTFTSVLIPTK